MARRLLPVVIATMLVGCTIAGSGPRAVAPVQPTEDMMPSEVLEQQDPGADTSRNPVLSRSETRSWLDGFLGRVFPATDPSYTGPAEPSHYHGGCRGCAAERPDGAAGLVLVAAVAAVAIRRRRGRASGRRRRG